MRSAASRWWMIVSVLTTAIACTPPCVDDGLHSRQDCPASTTGTTTTGTSTGTTSTDTTSTDTTSTDATTSTSTSTSVTGSSSTSPVDSTGSTGAGSSSGGLPCDDLMQNGDESDVDCGGSCPPCANNGLCNDDADCASMACHYVGICVPPTCADGIYDVDEIGLDCGGIICGKTCGLGANCASEDECYVGVCAMGKCGLDPTCGTGEQEFDETDIDCGGVCGPTCKFGQACLVNGDCISDSCTNDKCDDPPQCSDKIKNGAETDVDCAGPCLPCQLGQGCVFTSDCGPNLFCNKGVCSP